FFDQYLRTIKIPIIDYKIKKKKIKYRYQNTVQNFSIPVKVTVDGNEIWISPTQKWKKIKNTNKNSTFEIDKNFYIENQKVN
ncbi:MAG: M1 family peptidase, partial [Flavobacteriaceae bacterium]|nr:M1 family peptidase [Flavobacteriaceae bacterium]